MWPGTEQPKGPSPDPTQLADLGIPMGLFCSHLSEVLDPGVGLMAESHPVTWGFWQDVKD